MAEKRENVVLDLSTETPDRPVIRIDGKDYHLAIADDFTFAEFTWLAREGSKFGDLWAAENTNGELEKQLDKLCRMAFHDIPDEVYEKLNDGQKLQVLNVFTEAVETIGMTLRQTARTSPKRSRGSKGSTAEQ
jgi:hypothetical protein